MHEVEMMAGRIAFIDKGRIADIGTIEKVKMKHFSDYEVIIKVREIRNAASLRKNGFRIKRKFLIKTVQTGGDMSGIISYLKQMGIEILNIETRKPSLEDYFVKITRSRRGEKK